MRDREQIVFDAAEDVAAALSNLAGCEDALIAVLDGRLANEAETGAPVYAVIAAMTHFREVAAARVTVITRSVSG